MYLHRFLFVGVFTTVALTVTTSVHVMYDSPKHYIKYVPGCLNIVFTTPHGGHLRPNSIPDREAGCYVDGKCVYVHGCTGQQNPMKCPAKILADSYTDEIATTIARTLKRLTGCAPHIVYNELHRSKLDCNREVEEAALNVPEAIEAYHNFTALIKLAQRTFGGPGVLFDFHAQSHLGNRTELGYGVATLNEGVITATESNVRALGMRKCRTDNACFESLVRGSNPKSLGFYLTAEGFPTLPSPTFPKPDPHGHYYVGGWDVNEYGSRKSGLIDSILLEIPAVVRFEPGIRRRYSEAVARAMKHFYDDNYRI